MNFLGIFIAISSIVGAVAYFYKDKEGQPIEPYKDYEVFLEAMLAYKDENGEYAKDLKKLQPFMPETYPVNFKRYGLSLDGKFLTISDRKSVV